MFNSAEKFDVNSRPQMGANKSHKLNGGDTNGIQEQNMNETTLAEQHEY